VVDTKIINFRVGQREFSNSWAFKYLCVLILLLLSILIAQAERLPVKVFTSADGLGSSFVNYLMRDSRGFLWFATRDGLSRFDGSRFVTYQVGTKDAPPGIENIFETSQGIYWISTTGGLYRYDPHSVPAISPTKTSDRLILNAEYINDWRGSFYEDKDRKLWFWSGGELNMLEEKDGQVSFRKVALTLPENPAANLGITDFRQARDGSFWIVTTWGIVRRLPDGRDIFYGIENPRTDFFASVLEDNEGRIWLTRASGVYVFKPEVSPSPTAGVADLNLDTLTQRQSGQQPRMPEKEGEIFKLEAIEGFGKVSTKYLYKSADGHIWISTSEGLIEFDGQVFHFYSAAQGFAGGNGKMVEDLDSNLWLGGDKNLLRLDRNGLTTFDAADGFKNSGILTIGESRDGKLYAAGSDFRQAAIFT
jgi:ligand-binding sensor domain-containing protein